MAIRVCPSQIVTGIVELVDPENHTIEPKITTLYLINNRSYGSFKISPLKQWYFFGILQRKSVKYENSLL